MKKLQPITLFEKLSALIFIAIAFYSVFTDDWNFAVFALLLAFIAYMQVIIRWLCFIAELLLNKK